MLHHAMKAAVIGTTIFLLIALSFILFFHPKDYPQAIPLYTQGQPTLGDPLAKVHLVAFEDPYCNNCAIFQRTIFKKIEEKYIRQGKVKYTSYLVSSFPNSSFVSSLLFCIHAQSTESFFTYLDLFYQNPLLALTPEELQTELLKLAKKNHLPLDFSELESCSAQGKYQKQVVENTNYARAIMGGVIKTPMIFVNGIRMLNPSLKELEQLIKSELDKGGK